MKQLAGYIKCEECNTDLKFIDGYNNNKTYGSKWVCPKCGQKKHVSKKQPN